jgi:hypothetical protein
MPSIESLSLTTRGQSVRDVIPFLQKFVIEHASLKYLKLTIASDACLIFYLFRPRGIRRFGEGEKSILEKYGGTVDIHPPGRMLDKSKTLEEWIWEAAKGEVLKIQPKPIASQSLQSDPQPTSSV